MFTCCRLPCSYKLSREAEAAADTNILSPKSQKSMVKRIST